MERVLGRSRHLVEVAWASLVLCRCVDHVNPRCSVSSVEVLLGVAVETTMSTSVHSALRGHTEIRILLTIGALIVLMSMEASIVSTSELLRIILHAIVESSESLFLVRVSVRGSCVIALVLLHRQVSKFCAWNIFSSHIVIVASELIVAFLVEVVSIWVKEVTSWKNVEAVLVVLSRSVFNFLSCIFLNMTRKFLLTVRCCLIWSVCIKLLSELCRRCRWLVLIVRNWTSCEAIHVRIFLLLELDVVSFEWIFTRHMVASVTLM